MKQTTCWFLAGVVLCAPVFAGTPTAVTAATPAAWKAAWVWSGGGPQRDAYSYFRKSFTLSGAATTATVRISADTRYALYVNGTRVGRGPARSHANHLAFDTWNVAPLLHKGANVLAALVHHTGESTMRYELGRPGFLCEANVTVGKTTVALQTDASWKTLPGAAWDAAQDRMNTALDFCEVYDARLAPANWNATTFNDAAWPNATVLGPAGMAPWTSLEPSDVPPPVETTLRPVSVVDALQVQVPENCARLHFLGLYAQQGWAVGYAATSLYAPKATTVTLQIGSDDGLKLWVNGQCVLTRGTARPAVPNQDSVDVPLHAGWNPALLKSVKITGPWDAYFGVSGLGAAGIVLSSEQDASKPGTWRIAPEVPFNGALGAAAGCAAVFPPEIANSTQGWTLVSAPVQPLQVAATALRWEARRRPAAVANAATLTSAAPNAKFQSVGRADNGVVLDMGKEVLGYPSITVKGATGGEVVDVGYAETLEDGAGNAVPPGTPGVLNPLRGDTNYADRFVCRAGDNTFEPFEKRGFRYVQVDIRNAAAPVTLAGVSVALSTYPTGARGAFSSSDPRLNAIWNTGAWTLRLCMDDSYTDGPWRERAQWWADARVEALSNYYAFGDAALVKRGLVQAAQTQDAEGVVRGVFPTDWDGARMPSFSLLWVLSLWEHYQYTGDASLLPAMLTVLDRLFAFCDAHTNPRLGLLEDVPYWVFIDWAPGMDGQRIGVSASLNAFYYRALTAAADIAHAANDTARANLYAARAAALKDAFNAHLWDANGGAYWDTLQGGVPDGRVTQHANALAVAFGIAPPEQWNRNLDRITTDASVIPVGTPYFAGYLLDALHAAGRDVEAIDYVRTQWGAMLDAGATTFWEKWANTDSLCHGWSTAPVRALPAWLLGVSPTLPGWKEWTMQPAWCGLASAAGTVPAPQGDIKASWTRAAKSLHVTLTVPAGTVAHLHIPIAGYEKAKWTLNKSTFPRTTVYEKSPAYWGIRLGPGTYAVDAAV